MSAPATREMPQDVSNFHHKTDNAQLTTQVIQQFIQAMDFVTLTLVCTPVCSFKSQEQQMKVQIHYESKHYKPEWRLTNSDPDLCVCENQKRMHIMLHLGMRFYRLSKFKLFSQFE